MHWPASVDIVIVNFHSSDDIRDCLGALGSWKHGRIWIVDNSCDPAEIAALRQMTSSRSEVTVLATKENLGFGCGCNLALTHSSSELVLLLNPDARISPEHLTTMVRILKSDPHLGAVSPATYWNTERSFVLPRPSAQTPLAHVCQVIASWWPAATRVAAQHMVRRTQKEMASTSPVHVDFLAGAILLLRRSAIDAAGGLFDSGYFMFFEDADLSLRMRRAGYRLALIPSAMAVHNYRHKPFKAGLMLQSQSRYFLLRHSWYARLSGKLRGIERLARPMQLEEWFDPLGTFNTVQEFEAATLGAGVEAFSPSLQMMPAIVRPIGCSGLGFTSQEWALLEPAPYVAWLSIGSMRRWVYFVRA